VREGAAPVVMDLLVERCRRGDAVAWTALYRRHAGTVDRFLRRVLGPQGDVEDLVQEVFTQVVKSLPGFRDESSLTTWLYGIASHVAHRHVGLEIRWRRRCVAWGEWMAGCASTVPDGAGGADARRAIRAVGETLGSLPLKDREVWVLREWEGLSTDEVAESLAIPEGTVRSRLHRARREIADALVRRGIVLDVGPRSEGVR
jgi:RNA polymerase sigma-70 factor, ECF subfamily